MDADHPAIAQDFELVSDGVPTAERRPSSLPPQYYLQNFRMALAALAERYAALLDTEESRFLEEFDRLAEPAQCLVARLAVRKGPLFRRVTLHYAEVPDVDLALDQLQALGWVDRNPELTAEDLMRVLRSDELRLALGTSRRRRKTLERPGTPATQLTLALQPDATAGMHRPLSGWSSHLAGAVVQFRAEPLVNRLRLLFFGNHLQTWAEFVLVDLGVRRYEQVRLNAQEGPFRNREEILHFYRLNECQARLDAGESALLVEPAAFVPDGLCGWLNEQFVQLHLRLADQLAQEGHSDLALLAYRACGEAEGLIRAARLQVRLGRHEAALRDAMTARALPCGEAQTEALERIIARLPRADCGAPRQRKRQDKPQILECCLVRPTKRQRVELAVIEQCGEPDSVMFYVENALLPALFGLLCWDAIFAPIPGAFFHPFQSAPADLYSARFRRQRSVQFERLLGLLDSGGHDAIIRETYRAKSGIRTRFVRWGRIRPQLLTLALQCIPAAHLRLCFDRLLEDLRENTTGLPDLVQFWPAEGRYRFIEVKGPGDRLQDNQRRWHSFFARHAIPAVVCQVQWHTPSPTP